MGTASDDAVFDSARLDELLRLRLLDTPPEEQFDRLTRLAARLLAAPIALVSLVDKNRQFFKSACGLPGPLSSLRETPLSHSFCQHVVASKASLVVDDARQHALLRHNPAVVDFNVIGYLGVPLTTSTGLVLGSLCVIDDKPRRWTGDDQLTMCELGTSVMTEISLRFAHDELLSANSRMQREAVDRERLLRALAHSEASLSAAQRLAGVGSFVLHKNADASVGHVSDEARRLLALDDAPMPTAIASFAAGVVHPEDRARVAAAMLRALARRERGEIEYRVRGEQVPSRTLLTAVEPDGASDIAGAVLCTALDVTERNRAEQQLAEYRNALSHVARVATAGEMATVMAHEINQPLAAIAHTASACIRLSRAGEVDRGELTEHLTDIASQARRASEIIRRIRHFVRKAPASHARVDLDHVVDDVQGLLAPFSKQLNVRIDRNGGVASHRVMGDEIQLGQMVLNLVRNALDAVAGNPAADRIVAIATGVDEEKRIFFEVDDSGAGVPIEMASRIFEPFFTTRADGLGMGLAIARTIAEQHQGELMLCGAEGRDRGARFRVVLPAVSS